MVLRLLKPPARMQTKELAIEFLRYIRHRFSNHTYISYRKSLWGLLDYTPNDYKDLTPEHVEHFLQMLPVSVNSKNTALTACKSLGKYADVCHSLANPFQKVKYLKKTPSRQRIISQAELDKVLSICRDGESSTLLFLANTGLRVSELRTLTEQNLSPDGRLLHIIGKGGRQRTVPLNKVAQKHLSKTINFSKSHQGPRTIYNICQQLSKRAGLSKAFGPHSLRHYFATRMSSKISLCLLSKLLGHKSTAITEQVYVHLHDSDLLGLTDVLSD